MRFPVTILTALCICTPLVAGQGGDPQVRPLGDLSVLPQFKSSVESKACVINSLDCGETVFGQIDIFDCDLNAGRWVDFWIFSGQAGETVTINASSTNFDTYLALLDNTGADPVGVAEDDDSGPGTNSRIVYTLGSSGSWAIGVVNVLPFDVGDYSLRLECSSGPAPPAAPSNLTATTLSSTEIQLYWQDNSDNEEEFRVESRLTGGGSYQDIGSVPANSTGAIVSDNSPDTSYDFRVRAGNAAGNSGYSNTATATTLTAGACQPSNTVLCLRDGRFRIESGRMGLDGYLPGVIVIADDGSAVMYYVNPTKWELIVNVQPRSGRYWLSASGLTEGREYDVTVTDVFTQESWSFALPDSNPRVTNAPLSRME